MRYGEAWAWIDAHYTNDGELDADDVAEMAADGFDVDLTEGEAAEALSDWIAGIRGEDQGGLREIDRRMLVSASREARDKFGALRTAAIHAAEELQAIGRLMDAALVEEHYGKLRATDTGEAAIR